MNACTGQLKSESSCEGVAYIQIIRWSRSLCVIIEAQDILRKFFDFVKYVWNLDIFDQEPKYAYALFACVLRFNVFV